MSDTPKPQFDWNNLNLLALLSLVFSVAGFHVPGIVLGHIALVQLKRNPQSGRGLAIAGLVVGYAAFALLALGFVFMLGWMLLDMRNGMGYRWT